jgi:hypothetical protein
MAGGAAGINPRRAGGSGLKDGVESRLAISTCVLKGGVEPTLTPNACRTYNPRPFHIA